VTGTRVLWILKSFQLYCYPSQRAVGHDFHDGNSGTRKGIRGWIQSTLQGQDTEYNSVIAGESDYRRTERSCLSEMTVVTGSSDT
jgi:hypothetical protein